MKPTQILPGTTYVGLEHISSEGGFESPLVVESGDLSSNKFLFSSDHVLYGKLRPYLRKIALPDFSGVCTTEIVPILPGPLLERRFLYYFLRQPNMVQFATERCSGANLPRLSPKLLAKFPVFFPPLAEQRRIAAILDKADAIRRQRKQAIRLTEELLRATFLDMFGDPVTNPKGWPVVTLAALTSGDIRNGLSPSTKGTYKARVLTLSSITRGRFDPTHQKVAMFDIALPKNKHVSTDDLLVCRGNGNIKLVGCGRFPTAEDSGLLFPDTVIGVPIKESKVDRHYMEFAWNAEGVRRQIERRARTTNGTYKVNQQVLRSIEVQLPSRTLQARFEQVAKISAAMKHRLESTEPDNLFNAFVQRAFRGEL